MKADAIKVQIKKSKKSNDKDIAKNVLIKCHIDMTSMISYHITENCKTHMM